METKQYAKVIEDNTGGLSLYVLNHQDGKCIFAHYDYEFTPGQLADDLEALQRDDSVDHWDGHNQDMADEWSSLEIDGIGRELVAELADGKLYTYPNRMGRAARLAFRLSASL